jgi:hypothetical protein
MGMKWFKGMTGVLICLMLFSGCLGAALVGAGAGGAMAGYKWMEGTMTQEYPRALPEMEKAVLKVCQYYHFKINHKSVSSIKGTINGVDQNGEEVKITLEAQPNHITAVSIRVGGFMGNKEASQMFHTRLAKELGL